MTSFCPNSTKGGKLHYDIPIGILCLESYFPKLRGHVRNPKTYPFPTVIHVLKGLDIPKLLFSPSNEAINILLDGAKELEHQGVHAIAGSCGFMALFQKELSNAVRIPIFTSSLLQLPLIRTMHGENARIGVLTASEKALTQKHLDAFHVDINSLHIKGMEGNTEFWETIILGQRHDFNLEALEKEIVNTACNFIQEAKLDTTVIPHAVAQEGAWALRVWPELATKRIIRSWPGLRVMPNDGVAIYSHLPEHQNVTLLNTHSAVTLAAVHSAYLPDFVLGKTLPECASGMTLSRFGYAC